MRSGRRPGRETPLRGRA
ncbi:hypothetical protein [Nocardia sp. NPDC059239]